MNTAKDGAQTGYLGHVAIAPDGKIGFNPEAIISGNVGGLSLHDFFATEIVQRKKADVVWSDILAEDNYIRGNALRHDMDGGAGDDILVNGSAPSYLYGNDGDDVLFLANTSGIQGGVRSDTFVINGNPTGSYLASDFEHGVDTIALDDSHFPELDGRITKANSRFDGAAVDADDRLVVTFSAGAGSASVYIDADGSGPETARLVGYVRTDVALSRSDFDVVRAGDLIPAEWQLQPTGSLTQPAASVFTEHVLNYHAPSMPMEPFGPHLI